MNYYIYPTRILHNTREIGNPCIAIDSLEPTVHHLEWISLPDALFRRGEQKLEMPAGHVKPDQPVRRPKRDKRLTARTK